LGDQDRFMSVAIAVATLLGKRWEGFRSVPYLCSAGVPTIGFGATYYENGVHVTLGDPPITKERAERLLAYHILRVYLPAVIKLCPNIDSPERLGAISDFTLNLGSGRLRASNLRKKILAGDWAAVPGELRKWTRGGGKVLRGLVLRREAEIGYL
jgi:lysozyme